MPLFQSNTLKANTGIIAVERAINGILSIILIPYSISHAGINVYGQWAIVSALTGYLASLDIGLSTSYEPFVSTYNSTGDRAGLSRFLASALTVAFFQNIMASIVLLAAGDFALQTFFKQSPTLELHLVYLLLPGIVLNQFSAVFLTVFRGLQQYHISSMTQIASRILHTVFLIIGLHHYHDIRAFILPYTAQAAFVFISFIVLYFFRLRTIRFSLQNISWLEIRRMFSFGSKVFVSYIAFITSQHFDKLLLGAFFTPVLVGLYEAASKLVFAVRDIPLLLTSALVPRSAELRAKSDSTTLKELFYSSSAAMAMLSGFLATYLLVNSHQLLQLILGKEFDSFAATVFKFLTVAALWHVVSGAATSIGRGQRLVKYEMCVTLFTLGLNVGGSLIFLHFFSFNGIVFGTALALFTSPFIYYFMIFGHFGLDLKRLYLESFMPSVVLALVGFAILRPTTDYLQLQPIPSLIISSILLGGLSHIYYVALRNPYYLVFLQKLPFLGKFYSKVIIL